MVERFGSQLSIRCQCRLLGVNRNRPGTQFRELSFDDLEICAAIDRIHLEDPSAGQRRLCDYIWDEKRKAVGRGRMRRLMAHMRICAVYPKPRTTVPELGTQPHPYLLRKREVGAPDEVWCADITYIPAPGGGFAYLFAIMDWKTRAVIAWRLSNSMPDAGFCVSVFREAIEKAGRAPEIFNTDQGCQFTSREWVSAVEEQGTAVSMDGRGCWVDNVFIERLWRSLKYEEVYLRSYEDLHEIERGIGRWLWRYNHVRPHSAHAGGKPWKEYRPEKREGSPPASPSDSATLRLRGMRAA